MGFESLTLQEVINKMKKLRQKYKIEKDKSKKSGNGRVKKWKFFDMMDHVMAKDPNVVPIHLHDSSAENEKIDAGNTFSTHSKLHLRTLLSGQL